MRTCPNCGKDTTAEMTAPCTKCGFSPVEAPEMGTTTYGGGAPTDVGEAGPKTERRRGGFGTALLILIVIGAFGFDAISGVLDDVNIDVGEILAPDPGPTSTEVEEALVSHGEQVGVAGIVAECPESSKEAGVGESFKCTIATPAGVSTEVKVTNQKDSFEWQGPPFTELEQPGG